MKNLLYAVILFFAVGLFNSLYAAQTTLYAPLNLGFESSVNRTPSSFWMMPQAYEKSGYIFEATDFKPSKGDFAGRLHAQTLADSGFKEGLIHQRISAYRFRGKTLRYKADVKGVMYNDTTKAYLFMQITLGTEDYIFQTLDSQPITNADWEEREIILDVPTDATDISFGLMLHGVGDVYIDNIELDMVQPKAALIENRKLKLSDQDIANMMDFANLYGLIRYYNPASESLTADWNAVLLSGLNKVMNKVKPDAMPALLKQHFSPICPTLEVGKKVGSNFKYDTKYKTNDTVMFSWLHVGAYSPYETDFFGSQYRNICMSSRIREGTLMQTVSLPQNYNGKTIEFSAMVKQKARDASGRSQLWLRVDREGGYVQSKRKSDFVFGDTEWTKLTVQSEIREDDVIALRLGLIAMGEVEVFFDNIEVKIVETGEQIPVKDTGAENGVFQAKPENGWYYPISVVEAGYAQEFTTKEAYQGSKSLSIKSNDAQYVALSQPGESYTYTSPQGYEAVFALSMYAKDTSYQTLPQAKKAADNFYYSKERPKSYVPTGNDVLSRIAIVTDLYAYLKNFGTDLAEYKDLDALYQKYLVAVSQKMTEEEFNATLNDFANTFKEPNIFIFNGWESEQYYTFPFRVLFTDNNELIVSQTADSTVAAVGDEILEINGIKVTEMFASDQSAYTKYVNTRELSRLRVGEKNSIVPMTILTAEGKKKKFEVKRSATLQEVIETRPPIMYQFNDSTAYVDLTAVSDKELMDGRMTFEPFKHIIFDCRGKIKVNPNALSLFLDESAKGINWIFNQYTAPYNLKNNSRTYKSTIKGHNHLPDKKIFLLCDERSVGITSDFIKIAKFHKIAKTYGRKAPASAQESIYFSLPGKYSFSFTPGKGIMPDGSISNEGETTPDVLIEFDKKTAAEYLPYLNRILFDIEKKK